MLELNGMMIDINKIETITKSSRDDWHWAYHGMFVGDPQLKINLISGREIKLNYDSILKRDRDYNTISKKCQELK